MPPANTIELASHDSHNLRLASRTSSWPAGCNVLRDPSDVCHESIELGTLAIRIDCIFTAMKKRFKSSSTACTRQVN